MYECMTYDYDFLNIISHLCRWSLCFMPHSSKFSRTPRRALGTLVGVFEWQHLCINQFSGRITKVATGDSWTGGWRKETVNNNREGAGGWDTLNCLVDRQLPGGWWVACINGPFHSLTKQWLPVNLEIWKLGCGVKFAFSNTLYYMMYDFNIQYIPSKIYRWACAIRMNPVQLLSDAKINPLKKFQKATFGVKNQIN